MDEVRPYMEWAGIALAVIMVVLLAILVPLSLRRNNRAIDAFDHPNLDELRICVANYRLKTVTNKMEALGWSVVSAEEAAEAAGHFQVLLKRRDEPTAASVKQILRELNRMLLLPIGPLELKRLGEENG